MGWNAPNDSCWSGVPIGAAMVSTLSTATSADALSTGGRGGCGEEGDGRAPLRINGRADAGLVLAEAALAGPPRALSQAEAGRSRGS